MSTSPLGIHVTKTALEWRSVADFLLVERICHTIREDASRKVQDGLDVEAIRRVKDVFIDEEIVRRKVN